MTAPVVGVLALQGDVAEHLAALQRSGAQARGVRLPDELAAVDALVIPGGESTTMARLLRVFGLWEPLAARLEAGMPCLGTCAGLILLAREVLDGRAEQPSLGVLDVGVRRNAYGRQVDSFETDLEVRGLDGPFHGVFIRAPSIERCGDGVEALAMHGGRPVAVAAGPHLGLAFHPEVGGDDRLHRLFVDSLRASP